MGQNDLVKRDHQHTQPAPQGRRERRQFVMFPEVVYRSHAADDHSQQDMGEHLQTAETDY